MGCLGNLRVHPLFQGHRTLLALLHRLAVGFERGGYPVMKFEYEAGPSGYIRKRRRTETTFRGRSDDSLVDLDGCETGMEPVAFFGEIGNLLFKFRANGLDPCLENFLMFARFDLLGFFELPFLFG